MSIAKTIAGIVPGIQAVSLVGTNLRGMDYYLNPKRSKKRKGYGNKGMMKMGVGNLIAIPLIGASASMVNALD